MAVLQDKQFKLTSTSEFSALGVSDLIFRNDDLHLSEVQ